MSGNNPVMLLDSLSAGEVPYSPGHRCSWWLVVPGWCQAGFTSAPVVVYTVFNVVMCRRWSSGNDSQLTISSLPLSLTWNL